MTDVVAALIWDGPRFMICQRPAHKARGLLWEFVGGKLEKGVYIVLIKAVNQVIVAVLKIMDLSAG